MTLGENGEDGGVSTAYAGLESMAVRDMNVSPTDLTIVVRDSGERTASRCREILHQLFPFADVVNVRGGSPQSSLRQSLLAGLRSGKKWTLCIDANVLVVPEIAGLLDESEALAAEVFAVQALVRDKLLLSRRPAGNHLYRTAMIASALPLIPRRESRQSEADMIQAMARKGFLLHQSRRVVGLHEYEQWYADIFDKAGLHAHDHRDWLGLLRPVWAQLAVVDADYRIAIAALEDASHDESPSELSQKAAPPPALDAIRRAVGAEKPPLTGSGDVPLHPMDDSWPADVRQRIEELQAALDEVVFPAPRRLDVWTAGLRASGRALSGWRRVIGGGDPTLALERPVGPREGPLKILFAIDSLAGGGAERVMADLASRLDPARWHVQIALTLGTERARLVPEDVDVIPLVDQAPPRAILRSPYLLKEIGAFVAAYLMRLGPQNRHQPYNRRELQFFCAMALALTAHATAWKADCILSFLPNSNLLALLGRAWQPHSIPIVCSDRNHLSSELQRLPAPSFRRFMIDRHYPYADRHLALTAEMAADLIRNYGVPEPSVVTIANGVDPEHLKRLATEPLDTAIGPTSADDLRIVSVGRLNIQKGIDTLLHALGRVRKPWRLILLGKGEEEDSLRALAATLGIEDRVHFAGWQPNPYSWMARCDLFILSSRWEGMPNVLLEAMALGLPVVATDCPTGPSQILDGGRWGALVPVDSPDLLAQAIEKLAGDSDLRARMSLASREGAQRYSLEGMVSAYERMFVDVIGR